MLLRLHSLLIPPEEASEVVSDAEGRWISFSANKETLMLLERKGLPEHLQKLECVDTVVFLQSLVCDLQDAGEVPLLYRFGIPIV